MDRTTEQKQANTLMIFGVTVAAGCFLIWLVSYIIAVAGTGLGFMNVIRNMFSMLIQAVVVAAPGLLCFLAVKNYADNEEEKNKSLKTAKIIAIIVLVVAGTNFLTGVISAVTAYNVANLIMSIAIAVSKAVAAVIALQFVSGVKTGKEVNFKWPFIIEIIFGVACVIGYLIATELLTSVIIAILLPALFWGSMNSLKKVNLKVLKGAVIGGIVAGTTGAVVGAAAAQAKENGGSAGQVVKNAVIGAAIAGDTGAVIGAAATKTENKK